MPWETTEQRSLEEALVTQSPFVARGVGTRTSARADPLAASTVFAPAIVATRPSGLVEADEEQLDASAALTFGSVEESEWESVVGAMDVEEFDETLQAEPEEAEQEETGAPFGMAKDALESEDPPSGSLGTLATVGQGIADAARAGAATAAVAAALARGVRDEKTLTNQIFSARHPDRAPTRKIAREERALAREWTDIRDRIVRPLLKTLREGAIVGKPFGPKPNPGFTNDPAFVTCLTAALPGPPADLRVALVDMTDPAAAVYAGVNDEKTVFAASQGKAAALFAAFELRERVRDALTTVPTTAPLGAVLRNIQTAWQPQLDSLKPRNSAAFRSFPRLNEIFDIRVVAGKWSVEFKSRGSIASLGSDAQAIGAGFSRIEKRFGFHELLELMARFSNDEAAARCIAALGYEYINAALVSAGLYEDGTGGMWLGAPYPHGLAAVSGDPSRDRLWMQEPTNQNSNISRRFQVGSPKSFATMFTLLARAKLVTPSSTTAAADEPNARILALLDPKTADFIRDALTDAGRGVTSARSKIGLIVHKYACEASLIERTKVVHGMRVRYVVVIMNDVAPFHLGADLLKGIDDCVLARHP